MEQGLVTTPTISAKDSVDGADVTISYAPFNLNGYAIVAGVVTVTVTAKDKSGNTDKCEFIVEVTDEEAPWANAGCAAGSGGGVADGTQCGGEQVPVTARGSDGKLSLGTPKPFAVQPCCVSTSSCQADVSSKYSVCKLATQEPTPTSTSP